MKHSNHYGVQAVLFDLSGTVLDYGCRGPVAAFMELFSRHGVEVTAADARKPMGSHKWDHIWAMLTDTEIAQKWEKKHQSPPSQDDLKRLYEQFTPLQVEILKNHCDLIPGVLEVIAELKKRNIRFACTTGFESRMIAGLIQETEKNGFVPELFVTPDLVGQGRPAPWMAFHAARVMNLYPMKTFIKVGDTPVDIEEAHAAGMWAVGVVRSGNEVGLAEDELEKMEPERREALIRTAKEKLSEYNPHYLIDSVADLVPVIESIEKRLKEGDRP